MRRNNFLITAIVAVITFASLSAFVHRSWGWHRGWRHGYCYYNDNDHNNKRKDAVKDSSNNY
jgi:hypothetical protein